VIEVAGLAYLLAIPAFYGVIASGQGRAAGESGARA
jgi:hypothetical protein